MSHRKRVLLFTGDGKGKTTAALGMALRAAGHGMRVMILQFLKQDSSTGEIAALAALPTVDLLQVGRGFVPPPNDPRRAEHAAAARDGLARARNATTSDQYDMVVLDEICGAVATGLLNEKHVLDLIASAAPGLCLVLTGRGATEGVIAAADTVTEMRCIKHALQDGMAAQKGVEL